MLLLFFAHSVGLPDNGRYLSPSSYLPPPALTLFLDTPCGSLSLAGLTSSWQHFGGVLVSNCTDAFATLIITTDQAGWFFSCIACFTDAVFHIQHPFMTSLNESLNHHLTTSNNHNYLHRMCYCCYPLYLSVSHGMHLFFSSLSGTPFC